MDSDFGETLFIALLLEIKVSVITKTVTYGGKTFNQTRNQTGMNNLTYSINAVIQELIEWLNWLKMVLIIKNNDYFSVFSLAIHDYF